MKLNKFAYLYSKPFGNHTLKIMKKYLEIYFKNLEKSWKYHGILSVRNSGNPDQFLNLHKKVMPLIVWVKEVIPSKAPRKFNDVSGEK